MPVLRNSRRGESVETHSSGRSSSGRETPYTRPPQQKKLPTKAARMTATPSRPRDVTPEPRKTKKTRKSGSGLLSDLREQGKPPTESQLARMKSTTSIRWKTPGTDDITLYRVNDDVVCLPAGAAIGKRGRQELTEAELWRGRIVDIRIPERDLTPHSDSEDDTPQPRDAWVMLAWYYSPLTFKDMGTPAQLKGYRKKDFGTNELIYTPSHIDPVHIDTLNGIEEIMNFDEADYDQQDIPEDTFFSRSEFDTNKGRWVEGPPTRECVCKKTYKLYEDTEMYYCPREGCHTWYHEECLEKENSRIRKKKAKEFEADWEAAFDEDYLDDIKKEVRALPEGESTEVPTRVRQYARRPIIKGGGYGTIGNIATTLRARWLCHQAKKGVKLPENCKDWCKYGRRDKFASTDRALTVKERVLRSKVPRYTPPKQGPFSYCYLCPKCQKYI